jgi:hypothetical protein
MSENENITKTHPADVVKGKINPQTIGGWRDGDGDTQIPIDPQPESEE